MYIVSNNKDYMKIFFKVYRRSFMIVFLITSLVMFSLNSPSLMAGDNEINVDNGLSFVYKDLNRLLSATVLNRGPSSRKRPSTIAAPLGSRISRSNTKMTRLEGNRVMFHLLKKDHKDLVKKTRKGLENLPNQMPLKYFTDNEQLAYWLNLRNIAVYEVIMDQYPISKLKRFMAKVEQKKLLKVEGVSLSIKDIEDLILINWPKPQVIYGFYNGTIGGPNIRDRAFTGRGVWSELDDNAKEFTNSLRGIQFLNNTAKVSTYYQKYATLFPNFKSDLRSHLKATLNSNLSLRLENTDKMKFNIHDWNIADLVNGHLGLSSASMMSAAALGLSGTPGTALFSIAGRASENVYTQGIPENILIYLKGIRKRRLDAEGIITIVEVDSNTRDLSVKKEEKKKKKKN